MNELIEKLAKESGLFTVIDGHCYGVTANNERVRKFAALVAEECALDLEQLSKKAGVVTIWPLIARDMRAKFPMPKP